MSEASKIIAFITDLLPVIGDLFRATKGDSDAAIRALRAALEAHRTVVDSEIKKKRRSS